MIIANVSENENDLFLKDLKLKLNIKSIKRLSSSKPEKNGMIVIELINRGELII